MLPFACVIALQISIVVHIDPSDSATSLSNVADHYVGLYTHGTIMSVTEESIIQKKVMPERV